MKILDDIFKDVDTYNNKNEHENKNKDTIDENLEINNDLNEILSKEDGKEYYKVNINNLN